MIVMKNIQVSILEISEDPNKHGYSASKLSLDAQWKDIPLLKIVFSTYIYREREI